MSTRPPSFGAHLLALATLAALLALSVYLARLHLGAFNAFAGPAIGAMKAAVVLFFFMKLKQSGAPIRFAACFGFVWLGILIVLTLGDFLNRVPVLIQ
jgi:cytochrome c oxidase subunit 4